jgi:TRAP-type C4-dicarboxylate transport system permease large subunit
MFGISTEAVKDVAERAARTFIQVFLALYTPVILGADSLGGLLDLSVASKAAAAGIAAVFSIVMGLLGTQTGSSKNDASVL